MGVEVGGNFGDLLEDLESFVFEVDSAEADGLELAQDAGDFAGFATEAPLAGEACTDPVGQKADAHMVDDAFGLAMEDGADLEVALEFAKSFFDFEKVFVVALELGANFSDRYRKVHADPVAVEDALLKLGVRCLPSDSEVLILDFDATDDPLHGNQEGRFFHGYYGNYCYLPLYCFCGSVPLWAQLRRSNADASEGTVEALQKIVAAIRERLPSVKIVVRADSGFSREEIMAWCEAQSDVFYLIGMARNPRLERLAGPATLRAAASFCLTGVASRSYMETPYRTCKSWSRDRRMLCKAETLPGNKNNPRFVTTNIPAEGIFSKSGEVLLEGGVSWLYEKGYCGRGNAENMIKQMVLDLDADRTSCSWMAANQMRLWFSSFAYLILERVRTIGLAGSSLAQATLGGVRLRLLKVAALVKVSVRRVHVALCSAFPLQGIFRQAAYRLERCASPSPG